MVTLELSSDNQKTKDYAAVVADIPPCNRLTIPQADPALQQLRRSDDARFASVLFGNSQGAWSLSNLGGLGPAPSPGEWIIADGYLEQKSLTLERIEGCPG